MARDRAQREAGRPGEGAAAPTFCFPAGRCSPAGRAGAEGAEGAVGGCCDCGKGPARSVLEAASFHGTLLAEHDDTPTDGAGAPTGTKN